MVYVVPIDSINEQVLYDFNLQVNDTLKGFSNNECNWIKTITSIDSIFIGSSYRKRWNNGAGLGSLSIIEGIGSSVGLLDFCPYTLSPCNHLGCFAENGQTFLSDGVFSSCDVITAIENNSSNINSENIYPNPFHSTATIKLKNDFENSELDIYNIHGEQIRQQRIISPITYIVRDGLCNGIYFYKVINMKGDLMSGKFAIE